MYKLENLAGKTRAQLTDDEWEFLIDEANRLLDRIERWVISFCQTAKRKRGV